MPEPRWFCLAAGEERWAVSEETVWFLSGPACVHPLPGAKSWCSGWLLLREQLVPVFGAGPFARTSPAQTFLVLRRGSALLALPADGVDLSWGEARADGAEGASLPTAGTLAGADGSRPAVLDVERLYRGLGLPIESPAEDRG